MTEQQRLTIRAELARRMGYTNFREVTLYSLAGPVNKLICDPPLGVEPNTRFFECSVTGRAAFSASVPPDPFTNAEDKDALVKWLAQEDGRWYCFVHALDKLLDTQDERSKQYPNPPFDNGRGLFYQAVKSFILAPLETVTLAAARALGIQEAGE